MSVITQDGDSALMMAVRRWDRSKVVSLLLEAEANTDLQNKVKCQWICTRRCGSEVSWVQSVETIVRETLWTILQ